MWMLFEAVWVCCICSGREGARAHDLGQCLHMHMGSLRENKIGDEGAGYLGVALQVNTTLTTLQ
jgi:hypothetical protein